MYKDYLFEITKGFNEGEEILCEAKSYKDAMNILLFNYGFMADELEFLGEYTVEEGEAMGLDTY